MTRKCLEKLLTHRFPLDILTKSSLVLRDLDLLAKFSVLKVGFTITTVNHEARRKYEPLSSPMEERLSALEELHSQGISTYAFLGPVLPRIVDVNEGLRNLIHSFAGAKVDRVVVDHLNLCWESWSICNQHVAESVLANKVLLARLWFLLVKN